MGADSRLGAGEPHAHGGDILRELQSRFPGRYECSHLRTLQRGLRKIRASVLQTPEEAGSPEGLLEHLLLPDELKLARPMPESLAASFFPLCEDAPSPKSTSTRSSDPRRTVEEPPARPVREESGTIPTGQAPSKSDPGKMTRRSATVSARSASQVPSPEKDQHLTIEQAIQDYLQAHRKVGHRPKTLEWHQMVLAHLHQYLRTECGVLLVHQISETIMRNWLRLLEQTPTTRGSPRSASTVETYARSARAFFGWLVERGMLACSPLNERAFPRTDVPLPHVVSLATFEQVMRAGFSQHVQARGAKRLIARDRALLWVLFDTGITVSEACALRIADLDQHAHVLRVRGKGGNERQMPLGATCLNHLRSHLRQMNPATRSGLARRQAGGDPLFSSQGKQPLTKNGVTMVCVRFRTRAGVRESTISPQILRHSFALRYLQAGGNPRGLQELLGYEGMAPVRQYLRWHDQLLHDQRQQGSEEV